MIMTTLYLELLRKGMSRSDSRINCCRSLWVLMEYENKHAAYGCEDFDPA